MAERIASYTGTKDRTNVVVKQQEKKVEQAGPSVPTRFEAVRSSALRLMRRRDAIAQWRWRAAVYQRRRVQDDAQKRSRRLDRARLVRRELMNCRANSAVAIRFLARIVGKDQLAAVGSGTGESFSAHTTPR